MIIATRNLKIRNRGINANVSVNLFIPEFADGAWVCRYEIDWPEGARRSFAAGIDAMQALYLALQKIGIDLYMSSHHAAGHLIWNEPNDGYGFPVPKNGREFLIGSDKAFEG